MSTESVRASSPSSKNVQTHYRARLDSDFFNPVLSDNLKNFLTAYKKKYPKATRVYPDILVEEANNRFDADSWNVSDPFIFGGEVKFYRTSNYFDIDELIKDLNRLVLLREHAVCNDVAMMVADTGLNRDDLRLAKETLNRFQRSGLEIRRYGC